MKKTLLTLWLFMPFFCSAQMIESFTDGNFTENPVWEGIVNNFSVNSDFKLQSAASVASTSFLLTRSTALENAVWECSFRIDYSSSSSNYACMYLSLSAPGVDPQSPVPTEAPLTLAGFQALNGYYVMIGGTADEVSLYRQQGGVKTKLIDGTDKRTDGKTVDITVKVKRDSIGVFTLQSRLATEAVYFTEGAVQDVSVQQSEWFGLLYTNTTTTGYSYFFDDITVSGRPVTPLPVLGPGDLCFNELMFHAPGSSAEYIEIFNRTEQKVQLAGKSVAIRRADGALAEAVTFPAGLLLEPGGYVAFTSDSIKLRNYFSLNNAASIVQCKWTTLNNEEGTLVLLDADRVSVIDTVYYSSRMHHVLIHNPEGVALEKMHPGLSSGAKNSWHSAASGCRYGTPGMQNSQYREPGDGGGALVELEQNWFSPDNDGANDRCIIRYSMPEAGYIMKLTVLTADGANQVQLHSAELLSGEGFTAWDGQNSEGRISNPGIYILVAELFHPERGVTKRLKMPVLLTIR
jgi:hypothetical protein